MKTCAAVIACLALCALAAGCSSDERLTGAWTRTQNTTSLSPGGGYIAEATRSTFEFSDNGQCSLKISTRLQADIAGFSSDTGDGAEEVTGPYETDGSRITIEFSDGSRIDAAYSIFLHEGRDALKLQVDGQKPVYYFRT